ncbi:MAG: hypothetical protein ACT4QC_11180 [Planctomycetaceae bacterium]
MPPDLERRLLAALTRREAVEPSAVTEPGPALSARAPRFVRRRWFLATFAASAAALAIGWLWLWRPAAPKWQIDDLTRRLLDESLSPAALPDFGQFASGALPVPPTTMRTHWISAPPRALIEGNAAVYFFDVPTKRGPTEARLLVIPIARLAEAPTAEAFLAGPAYYPALERCSTAWVEGKFAYICCVKGGENILQKLRPARPETT